MNKKEYRYVVTITQEMSIYLSEDDINTERPEAFKDLATEMAFEAPTFAWETVDDSCYFWGVVDAIN